MSKHRKHQIIPYGKLMGASIGGMLAPLQCGEVEHCVPPEDMNFCTQASSIPDCTAPAVDADSGLPSYLCHFLC